MSSKTQPLQNCFIAEIEGFDMIFYSFEYILAMKSLENAESTLYFSPAGEPWVNSVYTFSQPGEYGAVFFHTRFCVVSLT